MPLPLAPALATLGTAGGASSAGSLLSSVGGAAGGLGQLAGGITSAIGASRQLSQGEQAARQYETTMNLFKNQLKSGPGWQRYGLEAAGYNPMLPFASGGGAALPGTHGSIQQPQFQNRLGALGDAISATAHSAAEVGRTLSQTDKIGADIQKIYTEIPNIQANTKLTNQNTKKAYASTMVDVTNAALNIAKGHMTVAQTDNLKAELKNINQKTALAAWETISAERRAYLLGNDMKISDMTTEMITSDIGRWLSALGITMQNISPALPSTSYRFK